MQGDLFLHRRRVSVVKFLPDFLEFRQVGEEDVDQVRIELPAFFRSEIFDNARDRPGCFVCPFAAQGVEDVGDRRDPAIEVDLLPFQARKGIAFAVEVLVMLHGDDRGRPP